MSSVSTSKQTMENRSDRACAQGKRSVGPFSLARDFVTDGWAFVRNMRTIRFDAEEDFKRLVEHFVPAGCVHCSIKVWKQRTHQLIRHQSDDLLSPKARQCCISSRRVKVIKSHAHQQCETFYRRLEDEINHYKWHRAVDNVLEPLPQEIKKMVELHLHAPESSKNDMTIEE